MTAELRLPLVDAPARGERRKVELGGHRIGLYRVGEELFALAYRCPHRGAPLCSSGRIATRAGRPKNAVALRWATPSRQSAGRRFSVRRGSS